MASAQFRQIGVPDGHQTTAAVRRHLQQAQQRTGALLSRRHLRPTNTLLRSLNALHKSVEQAYSCLQLRRLSMLLVKLEEIRQDIEHNRWFHDNVFGGQQALYQVYQDINSILRDVTPHKTPQKTNETEEQFKNFLETAATRGWRVPEYKTVERADDDGVAQSCRYIRRVSIPSERLLKLSDNYGWVRCAILLLNDPPIPESVLTEWTKPPWGLDVYIVFGYYVVLPNSLVLGVRPRLNDIHDETVSFNQFSTACNHSASEADVARLIYFPRRVSHHYYCPVLNLNRKNWKYIHKWDILVD